MNNSQFVATVHSDYLPFIDIATDEELAQFIRAQISYARGEAVPELEGMAKALFDVHIALMARLEEASAKKSEAGKKGGAPAGNQNAKKQPETTKNNQEQAEVEIKQPCLKKNKPISVSVPEPKDLEPDSPSENGAPEENGALSGVENLDPPPGDTPPGEDEGAAFKLTYAELAKGWNETMAPGGFPRMMPDSAARQRGLNARIREDPRARQNPMWWYALFKRIAASDFLSGRSCASGREPFRCDLGWILRPENMTKILEGKYDNRASPGDLDGPEFVPWNGEEEEHERAV